MTRASLVDGLIVLVAFILFICAIVFPPAAFVGGLVIILGLAFGGDA